MGLGLEAGEKYWVPVKNIHLCSCSCLGSLTQVAQPAYQAQALCPDEGGGEELPDLVHYNLQLLVRHLPPQRPGLGCQLGELMVEPIFRKG